MKLMVNQAYDNKVENVRDDSRLETTRNLLGMDHGIAFDLKGFLGKRTWWA